MNKNQFTQHNSPLWRRWLWFCILWLTTIQGSTAQSYRAEYWVDSDPGLGRATALAVAAGSAQASIPTGALADGWHMIGLRARNNVRWSQTYRYMFYSEEHAVTDITAAEYYIDADPGLNKGTAIAFTPSASSIAFSIDNLDALPDGWHTVGMRVRKGGNWSQTYRYMFYTNGHAITDITAAEYYIDSDPGLGKGSAIAFTPDATSIAFSLSNLDVLADGWHTIGMRVRKGSFWSQTYRYTFYTNAHSSTGITAAEYFFDTDPGFGKGTAIPFTADATTLTFDVNNLDQLPGGWHNIGMRVKKGSNWSQTYTRSFLNANIQAQMQVEKVEAWWDDDLTTLASVPFAWSNGVATVSNYEMSATALTNGQHLLHLRATADGRESIIRTYEVCKTAQPAFSIANEAICEGQPVYFEDLTTGADNNTTYKWDINNDGVTDYTDIGGAVHTYATAGTYTVTLTVQDGENCEATYSQEITVSSAANPSVTLAMTSTICAGDEVTMTATPQNAGSTPQYEWLVNNKVVATTTEPTYAYSKFANGDKAAVRLTASNPCATQPVVTSTEVTMAVNALPEITLTMPETIYSDAGMMQLAGYATPTGGKFYVDDAVKTFFNAGTIGLGSHTLRYVVKNANNCEAEAEMTFTIAERPTYTVTFVDEDGTTILQQTQVKLDAMPTPPADPTKAATAQYTYTFTGWTPTIVAATADATYTATYSSTVNKYTVTFVDEDGETVLDSKQYEYGATPVAPADPTKQATAQYTYTFTGWTPAIVAVTCDATYKATYGSSVNRYTITFIDEDGTTVLASDEYEYGETPEPPADPSKPADDEYTYTFSGWTPEIVAVVGEATYTAQYDATPIKPVVTCEPVSATWLATGGTDLGEMTTDNTNVWFYDAKYGAKGTKSGGVTAYLLTPAKDLSGAAKVTLAFSHTHKFAGTPSEELTLWVTADYKGSVDASEWQQLTIAPYAANTNWTFVDVVINVPAGSVGENTVFGFKYMSTASAYATWEIKDLQLTSKCNDIGTTFEIPTTTPGPRKVIERAKLFIILPDGTRYDATGVKVQ